MFEITLMWKHMEFDEILRSGVSTYAIFVSYFLSTSFF